MGVATSSPLENREPVAWVGEGARWTNRTGGTVLSWLFHLSLFPEAFFFFFLEILEQEQKQPRQQNSPFLSTRVWLPQPTRFCSRLATSFPSLGVWFCPAKAAAQRQQPGCSGGKGHHPAQPQPLLPPSPRSGTRCGSPVNWGFSEGHFLPLGQL